MIQRIGNKGLIRQFLTLVLTLIIVGLGILFWTEIKNPVNQMKDNAILSQALLENRQNMDEDLVSINLFFASRDQSFLVMEAREVKKTESTFNQQIRQVLQELIKGPDTDLISTIPSDTKLRSFYLDKDGIGYIDFTSELILDHPGGSWAEMLTVYSIVNTVIKNFPRISRVKLLINGAEIETLCGHLDMQEAFLYNESLVQKQDVHPEVRD